MSFQTYASQYGWIVMLGQARTNAYNGTIKICTANTLSVCIYAYIGVTYVVEDITTATRMALFLIIYICVLLYL